MPSIRLIRRRIRSVQATAKVTRAMEMIAASKMRRAQERGLAGRPYADKIRQVISDLAALPESGSTHPLLERRPENKIAIIHITPDRGLSGGLHSVLNRNLTAFMLEQKAPVSLVAVGRKGRDFARRVGFDMQAEFSNLGDRPSQLDTLPISRIIIDDYTNRVVDKVYIAYARFITTMSQEPVIQQLLPVEPAPIPRAQNVEYIYEPGARAVLDGLLTRFVEMTVYHIILESIASEQSARMVAMRNATENAEELIQNLTLLYNKARQESITKELLEITGGAAALE